MVTLSEFASYLSEINATLDLMEKAYSHVQQGGKAEPVSRWALNVLRKFSFDEQKPGADVARAEENAFTEQEQNFPLPDDKGVFLQGGGGMDVNQWNTESLLDQEFPSLEEMFLGF
jgi:hypothetical protein